MYGGWRPWCFAPQDIDRPSDGDLAADGKSTTELTWADEPAQDESK
jgi:hypothetical protein